ncbi:MAG: NADH-ubiquinone oxidoreductase chain [Phycisphaerales bacterium]|nr:NADH-ubiquinone oxidoreductase chain [Phycisphaerales bacterium]
MTNDQGRMTLPPYIPAWPDLRPFVADLWLLGTAVAVLLVAFVVRRPNTAAATVAFVGMAGGLVSLLAVGPADGGRFAPMLAADGVAFFWKVLLLTFALGVVLLWFATTRFETPEGDGPEFFLLLASATLGLSLMGSAANLLMLLLAVEMASLPSYALAGFRKRHKPAAEAAMKYVLFGAAASAVMIWGLSLVYGACGTLNLYPAMLADGTRVAGVADRAVAVGQAGVGGGAGLLLAGLLAVVVGLGFKVSAAPFHLWAPDVFEGARVDVAAFLSVASKGAGLVLTLRLAAALAEPAGAATAPASLTLAGVLAGMAALTCTLGNTAAYAQTNLKRLLAYSSIAHAGYMLCAVALVAGGGGAAGGATAASAGDAGHPGTHALLLYLAVYLFMNLGAFAVVAVVGRQVGGVTLAHFAGLGRRAPALAGAMTLCLFSLIGVPPLAGFTAKFTLMTALATAGGWWWALVAVVAANTLLSIYYYAGVVRAMYLQEPAAAAGDGTAEGLAADDAAGAGDLPFGQNRLGTGLAVGSAFVLVVLFVGGNALSRAASAHATLRSAGRPAAAGQPVATAATP